MRHVIIALTLLALLGGCAPVDGSDHEHADLNNLQASVDALAADLDAAEATMAEQATTIAELQAELDAVAGGVDLTELAADVADHETRLATLETDPVTRAEVDAADGALSGRIDALEGSAATWDSDIAANAAAVATNAADIATNAADIGTNTANVATNTADIATNAADIAANAANIATGAAALVTMTSDIATNTADIAANTADIATNTADVATNTADIATNATDIASNTADVATNAAGIATNTADVATNTADVATNTADVATNTADVATNTADIATNTAGIAANAAALASAPALSLAGTVHNPAASCDALLTAVPGLTDGKYWLLGASGLPYEAWCDMTTDNGGWTLLGTVFGGDRNMWNVRTKIWANEVPFGSADSPFSDHKSAAWYDLDLTGAEILFERRYDGDVMAQTVIGNPCLTDGTTGSVATYFNELFVDWNDFQTPCSTTNLTTLTAAADTTGLYTSDYMEGSGSAALGGAGTNGFCWNGADTNSNTFSAHIGWNQSTYSTCSAAGHLGYVGVFTNGSSQYSNRDIDTTNWLYSTDTTYTGISLYAR